MFITTTNRSRLNARMTLIGDSLLRCADPSNHRTIWFSLVLCAKPAIGHIQYVPNEYTQLIRLSKEINW